MDIATDASSIINLSNGGVLDTVAQLRHCDICISPLVAGECDPSCAANIKAFSDNGWIELLNSSQIPAQLYLDFLQNYELGEGETECIALCCVTQYHFCCDDNRARRVAREHIGEGRILGSLRLVRWSVVERLLSPAEAFAAYQRMKSAGGFLPEVTPEYFESDAY